MTSFRFRLSEQDRQFWHMQVSDVRPLRHDRRYTKGAAILSNNVTITQHDKDPIPSWSQTCLTQSQRNGVRPCVSPRRRSSRKNQRRVDGRLDLHGMTQNEAYQALARFLYYSITKGRYCVLIISGKGTPKPENDYQNGVLRRVVPQWFSASRFGCLIVSIDSAHAKDGGSGAFYVVLRRRERLGGSDLQGLCGLGVDLYPRSA